MSTATRRLARDYLHLKKDPIPYVTAEPFPTNMLEWHYVIEGPKNSPYEGGYYHGKLIFPKDFPFKPPAIIMLTPNGRFKTNYRLCLNISDYHPSTWNPSWTISSILTGLLSFMLDDEITFGSIMSSEREKRQLAKKSLVFNLKNETFRELFPDIYQKLINEQRRKELMERSMQNGNSGDIETNNARSRDECQKLPSEFAGYLIGILCLLLFSIIVKYVFYLLD